MAFLMMIGSKLPPRSRGTSKSGTGGLSQDRFGADAVTQIGALPIRGGPTLAQWAENVDEHVTEIPESSEIVFVKRFG